MSREHDFPETPGVILIQELQSISPAGLSSLLTEMTHVKNFV